VRFSERIVGYNFAELRRKVVWFTNKWRKFAHGKSLSLRKQKDVD